MFPIITIFNGTNFCKDFLDDGFQPLLDSLHGNDPNWIMRNYADCPHRFYLIENDYIYDYVAEDYKEIHEDSYAVPDFSISFNHTDSLDFMDWRLINRYLSHILLEHYISLEELDQFNEKFEKPKLQKCEFEESFISEEKREYYTFKFKELPEYDMCIYEVTKPNVDRPYTSVTRNYSTNGHLYFFTSLYFFDSWGPPIGRFDNNFLEKVWYDELKMPTEFDLDTLLKERVRRCFPDGNGVPETEPEVYRKSLESVLETLKRRNYERTGNKRFINS